MTLFSPGATVFTGPNASTIDIFTQYGTILSGKSSLKTSNPFYSFTIGDKTTIYDAWQMTNPSLPMAVILKRLQAYKAFLAIVPGNSSSTECVAQAQRLSSYFRGLFRCRSCVQSFGAEKILMEYILNKDYNKPGYGTGKVAFAIILHQAEVKSAQWDYTIRSNFTLPSLRTAAPSVACLNGRTYNNFKAPNYTSYRYPCRFNYGVPSTKVFTDDLKKPQIVDYVFGYGYSGFASIQLAVDQFIFSQYGVVPNVQASVSLMPTAAYKYSNFQALVSSTLAIFYMLSYLFPVSRLVRALVAEKETRTKEGMKMMGLTNIAYNCSWLVLAFVQITSVASGITLVTLNVFQYSEKIYLFVYFESFGLATMSMCFLLSTLFARSKTASFLGPLIFFCTFFPFYSVSDPEFDTATKIAVSLVSSQCCVPLSGLHTDIPS